MPLEATLIVIDNSEYMRNGDYHPNRFDAQADAVNAVFQTKIDSNPENTVGIMTMAGKGPEVLVTHTKDLGQILQATHATADNIGGTADIPTAIAVAQLALKHRQNKNLRQRIIVFVGSPLQGQGADEKYMVKLAKKLKKNNVNVDFVAFGDGIEEGERSVLKTFIDNASSGDNCHLVSVPPGTHLLSDMVISSSILAGDRGIPEEAMGDVASGSGVGGAGGFEFGVDPSLDPELAMALRMSMEEEQARQAAAAQAQASAAPTADVASSAPSAAAPPVHVPATAQLIDEDDEDVMLQQALAMSQAQDVEMADHAASHETEDEESEEDAIKRAIEMSMRQEGKQEDHDKH
ncbi:26S proteasome non-ATPase regulatory subunit 4 [Grifola frondosa]|uniref:26S proteasome non-ATPase regulatory subunit 4 n=1 Tax=Grifola frondosa TaxID=5627 RepID=A0A1C7LPQ4_GRIFR|nr:26S proteasome non-ATPase regulatory subunit 4 [Grifola frondosa]